MVKPNPKCILTNLETDCIKNANEQNDSFSDTNRLSARNTGIAFDIALSYITSLVTINPDIIKEKCGNELGNKFLYEYGKCKDNTGKIQTRYKYIDTTCESGGTFGSSQTGLIPCAVNSATNVASAAVEIPNAIFQDSIPPCELINNISCKVSNKGKAVFIGTTNAHIAYGDYGNNETPVSGFENLYESVNDYVITNDLNFNNIDEIINIDNDIYHQKFKSDSTLNEIYYIMLMIFLLFIIYKLMHKK